MKNYFQYKQAIADKLKCKSDQVFLYWKGRVALYAILKAMGIKEGDEVIIPGFTCVVVPNAIFYLGAKPVYVDINIENYNMDSQKIKDAVTQKTKAILCQNTFGLSSNIEQIIQIAEERKLFTIEDCTHGFSGYYNGKPNGSYCDAAFYSSQWNKPFSTGIGGFLVVKNELLIDKVRLLEYEKLRPTLWAELLLYLLLIFRKYFINNYTYKSLVGLFRLLSKKNLIIGSSQGDELSGIKMPEKYFTGITKTQIRAGIKELKKLEYINTLRKENAEAYTRFLKSKGKTFVAEKHFGNHLFLKYPLLVKERERFVQLAEKNKITLGDWFLSPLHPIKGNLKIWDFDEKKYPNAVEISKKIVNLPTDINYNKRVLNFLNLYIDMVE